jgi:hypothetical protein
MCMRARSSPKRRAIAYTNQRRSGKCTHMNSSGNKAPRITYHTSHNNNNTVHRRKVKQAAPTSGTSLPFNQDSKGKKRPVSIRGREGERGRESRERGREGERERERERNTHTQKEVENRTTQNNRQPVIRDSKLQAVAVVEWQQAVARLRGCAVRVESVARLRGCAVRVESSRTERTDRRMSQTGACWHRSRACLSRNPPLHLCCSLLLPCQRRRSCRCWQPTLPGARAAQRLPWVRGALWQQQQQQQQQLPSPSC